MRSGLLILFLANLLGGAFTPMFVKLGVREIPPLTFTLFRFIVASLVLIPFVFKSKENIGISDFYKISLYSIFFSINVAFFGLGIQYTTAITSQILYTLSPLIVGLLSFFILKEKFNRYKIAGSVIAFTGVIYLISGSIDNSLISSLGSPIGNLLVLVAVIAWSSYIVVSKKLTNKFNPLTTSFISFVTTVIVLTPFSLFEIFSRPVASYQVTQIAVISVFGSGILSSALMFFLIQLGIKKTSSYTASLFMYFAPLFGSITAIPILKEKITVELIGGGLLIILGVFIATTLQYSLKKSGSKFTK